MAFLRKKTFGSSSYWYLCVGYRRGGKVLHRTAYLGRDTLSKRKLAELKKAKLPGLLRQVEREKKAGKAKKK